MVHSLHLLLSYANISSRPVSKVSWNASSLTISTNPRLLSSSVGSRRGVDAPSCIKPKTHAKKHSPGIFSKLMSTGSVNSATDLKVFLLIWAWSRFSSKTWSKPSRSSAFGRLGSRHGWSSQFLFLEVHPHLQVSPSRWWFVLVHQYRSALFSFSSRVPNDVNSLEKDWQAIAFGAGYFGDDCISSG